MKAISITPQFVEFIPSTLQDGVLYISQKYSTAAHKCCCGCGIKIVTPITPTDWRLTVSGNEVTLHPSIGNWNHPCQSHYIIRSNRVIWVGAMTQQQINWGRDRDRANKRAYYGRNKDSNVAKEPKKTALNSVSNNTDIDMLAIIKRWIKSLF